MTMSDYENEYTVYAPRGHEYTQIGGILKKIEVYEAEEEQKRKQSSSSSGSGDHKTPSEGSRRAKRLSPSTEDDDEQNPLKKRSINADSGFHSKEESLDGESRWSPAEESLDGERVGELAAHDCDIMKNDEVETMFNYMFNTSTERQGRTLEDQLQDRQYLFSKPTELSNEMMRKIGIYNYRCVLLGANERKILFSLGSSDVYQLEDGFQWTEVKDVQIELPRNTLVEVEFVDEYEGQGPNQRVVKTVHIVDGLVLAGKDIRNLHYNDRIAALKKVPREGLKVKEVYRLEHVKYIFRRMQEQMINGDSQSCYKIEQSTSYFVPKGILLMKIVSDPWTIQVSRAQNKKYFFNKSTKESTFSTTVDSTASHKSTKKNSIIWSLDGSIPQRDVLDYIQSQHSIQN